jgi:hypothetical protein
MWSPDTPVVRDVSSPFGSSFPWFGYPVIVSVIQFYGMTKSYNQPVLRDHSLFCVAPVLLYCFILRDDSIWHIAPLYGTSFRFPVVHSTIQSHKIHQSITHPHHLHPSIHPSSTPITQRIIVCECSSLQLILNHIPPHCFPLSNNAFWFLEISHTHGWCVDVM